MALNRLNSQGPTARTAAQLLDKAHDAIDQFLSELITSELSDSDLKLQPYSTEKSLAMDTMLRHGLIHLRSGDPNSSIIDIKAKGIEVANMGGIRTFLATLEKKNDSTDQIQALTKQVLEIQIRNNEKEEELKQLQTRLTALQLENYPTTKQLAEEADKIGRKGLSAAKISMWIAIGSLLLTLLLELGKHYKIWS